MSTACVGVCFLNMLWRQVCRECLCWFTPTLLVVKGQGHLLTAVALDPLALEGCQDE